MKSEHDHIIRECQIKSRKTRRLCFVHNCDAKPINSHVIWKSGILKSIAAESHVMSLNVKKRLYQDKIEFKRTGINEILSFKGLCQHHDHKLFKDIEQNETDYGILKNQILLSVRGVFHEFRKKEIVRDWATCVLKKYRFPVETMRSKYIHLRHNQILGLNDLNFFIKELNHEAHNPTGRFYFKQFFLPRIPVVASSLFNADSLETMILGKLNDENWESKPLNTILFNIFPQKEKTVVVIGFHSMFLQNLTVINKVNSFEKHELLKFISDILIERIESWACSIEFYQKHIFPNEEEILSDYLLEPRDFDGSLSNKFNLFENWS